MPSSGDCVKQERGKVLAIDHLTNRSATLAQVGYSPKGITVDSHNKVYVANQLSDNISVINGSTGSIVNNLTLQGGRPIEILYNSFNQHIYVTNGFNNSVDVIDGQTDKVVDISLVGDNPTYAAYNNQNKNLYVSNQFGNVTVLQDHG